MLSTPSCIISSKCARTLFGSAPSKSVVFVVTRKPRRIASLIPSVAISYPPSRQTEKSWCSRCPSTCTENVRYLLAFNDLVDLGMHERLPAGDADDWRAAFIDRAKAFFRCELLLENMWRILDFAASGAGQIAAEEWFEHEDERIPLASCELLPQDVS